MGYFAGGVSIYILQQMDSADRFYLAFRSSVTGSYSPYCSVWKKCDDGDHL